MKKTILAASAVVALTSLPNAAFADLSFNVGAVTDYRYRGISQTRLKPAVQGGIDYSNGGFYVGTWASTIKWIKDAGGDDDVELDLYGGYKGDIIKDSLSYDVGLLRYQYPSNKLNPNANTTEVYGALTYGAFTFKLSDSVTNLFGNPDSKNSMYGDLSASFDVYEGLTVAPHVGYQKIHGTNSSVGSYWDYSLTLSKDFKGFVPSIAIVGTRSADKAFYSAPNDGKALAGATVVAGVKFNF